MVVRLIDHSRCSAKLRTSAKALGIVCGMLSKASKRSHIDGAERGERILHRHTRCAVDDEARGLQYFEKSRGKGRAERLRVAYDSGGVLEALIDVADLSIITDCELASEKTYLLWFASSNSAIRVFKSSKRPGLTASSITQYIFSVCVFICFLSGGFRMGCRQLTCCEISQSRQ